MKTALQVISVLVVLGVVGVVIHNVRTRRYDFFSWRNLFLLGFALFYGAGSYFTVESDVAADLYVPSESGYTLLLGGIVLFVVMFVAGCAVGGRMGWVGRLVPRLELPVTGVGVLAAAVALMVSGVVASVLEMTSYVSVLAVQFKGGLVAAGVALATYYVVARRFNPVGWVVFLGALVMAGLVSTVGEGGRRGLLGVFMAVAWMWYYFSLRYQPARRTVVRLGGMAIATVLVIATYASIRHETVDGQAWGLQSRAQQIARLITNPTVRHGAFQQMVYSDTPTNTMFIMENYPSSYEYVPFHGLIFFLGHPIPRAIWPTKPEGLGIQIQRHLNATANLGTGIIGHGWAEGSWLGILGYAVFFGALVTAADRLIRERAWNPYFLAATGSSLGNVFALARGETSLFLVTTVASFVGSAVVLYLVKATVGPVAAAAPPLTIPVVEEAFAGGSVGDEDAGREPGAAEQSGYAETEHGQMTWTAEVGTAPSEFGDPAQHDGPGVDGGAAR